MIPLSAMNFLWTEWHESWYFSAVYYGLFSPLIVGSRHSKKSYYKIQQPINFLHPFHITEMSEQKVWSLFNSIALNFLLRYGFCFLCRSVGMLYTLRRHKIPLFCLVLSLFWDQSGLCMEKNSVTSSLKFLLYVAESGRGSCIFPIPLGNTYAVTWRCYLYRYWLNFGILYGFTMSQTLYITLIKLFNITYPWSLLLILYLTDEFLMTQATLSNKVT